MEDSCRLAGLHGSPLDAGTTAASLGQRTICNHTRFRAFLQSARLAVGIGRTGTLARPRVRRRYRAGLPRVAVLLRLDSRKTCNARLWARFRARQNYNAGREGMSMKDRKSV